MFYVQHSHGPHLYNMETVELNCKKLMLQKFPDKICIIFLGATKAYRFFLLFFIYLFQLFWNHSVVLCWSIKNSKFYRVFAFTTAQRRYSSPAGPRFNKHPFFNVKNIVCALSSVCQESFAHISAGLHKTESVYTCKESLWAKRMCFVRFRKIILGFLQERKWNLVIAVS